MRHGEFESSIRYSLFYNLRPDISWVLIGQYLIFCLPTWSAFFTYLKNVEQLSLGRGKKLDFQSSYKEPNNTWKMGFNKLMTFFILVFLLGISSIFFFCHLLTTNHLLYKKAHHISSIFITDIQKHITSYQSSLQTSACNEGCTRHK